MIIAQISDTHIALDAPDAKRRLADLECTIAGINKLDPGPDAIVHTGDIVHNGQLNEYEQAQAILTTARAPVYALCGNKDDRTNLRATFSVGGYLASDFAYIQYSIDDYPVRLIGVDTQGSGNKGSFCRERLEHLADLIEADVTEKPIAIFTHHPPFLVTEGPEAFHFESPDTMSMLRCELSRSGRVVAIFSGHVHRATFGSVESIPATVVPAIATTLRRGQYPPSLTGRPVYQVHRFNPLGGFATETRIAGKPPVAEASSTEPH